ncbi:MAG TPA: glycerol-3-phosphate 1-O-acyltransferase [Firmicutes bacterium]|nr:MAG: acyl-phosphate glycerol 3-phosphate acyltransferase [Candidatus Coatesbacteria bacterium]RLC43676.1 MAG: acyl-phosphate glycerol 3-phosphate acyltransferase [Candidatus Coatesbacteria bacterium]HEC80365.1 glycerol-3-phosphate 1-O-acyltransferase [Bacillota bacterium]
MMKLAIAFIISYLVGAIPFSLIIGIIFGGVDIRKIGSGNIGSTNLARAMGYRWGILAFLIDVAKGALPVLILPNTLGLSGSLGGVVCAVGAIIGHMVPVYLAFRGGKGVATALGAMVALTPIPAIICFTIFIIVVAFTRFVSLGSITATSLLPPIFILYNHLSGKPTDIPIITLTLIIAIGVVISHKSNISRLLSGTERRIGEKAERGNSTK